MTEQKRRRIGRARRGRLWIRNHVFEILESRVLLASDLLYPGNSQVTDFTLLAQTGRASPTDTS